MNQHQLCINQRPLTGKTLFANNIRSIKQTPSHAQLEHEFVPLIWRFSAQNIRDD